MYFGYCEQPSMLTVHNNFSKMITRWIFTTSIGYNSHMNSLVWIIAAFLSGALPFSVWLGKIFSGKDVRSIGDGNPGATNVFRAGNKIAGLLALLLDISKAAVPVGLAYHNFGITGAPMFFIATAPVLGHMFSPFLGFRGGKALATALGVWIGLTLWKASLAAVIFVALGLVLFRVPGWAAMTGLSGIFAVLIIWLPEPLLFAVLAAQVLLLGWTHRHDLRSRPRLSLGQKISPRRAKT
jgi:acyl phosphate:glycerol-3-phosphate acyltransferase